MSELHITPNVETENNFGIEDLFSALTELEPKPIANFVPTNAVEQKKLFLSGEIRNPDHEYTKLAAIDFATNRQKISEIGERLVSHPETQDKYTGVYQQFIQNYLDKTRFMELANAFNNAETIEERETAKNNYMQLNIELYGEPDLATYQSLIGEKITMIQSRDLSDDDQNIRDELFAMIGDIGNGKAERFKPSEKTIDWLHDITVSEESLYGSLLEHVPEKELFSDTEIQAIFETIITKEFNLELGMSSDDDGKLWQVVVEDAQSINVKAADKKIIIPIGREVDLSTMKTLVAHEIGVHFLRSVMGEQTDLAPLKWGLSNYYDTEEGLGMVMEQAVAGTYQEAGVSHYITAGLALHGGKDFRDIFEINWRLKVLSRTNNDPTEETIDKAKITAYGSTMRIMRGTDELPWFKDLSYYNGATEVWKHLESIQGDDTEFMLVLLGKANSADAKHRRTLLETATA